jgi:hypothetical protein
MPPAAILPGGRRAPRSRLIREADGAAAKATEGERQAPRDGRGDQRVPLDVHGDAVGLEALVRRGVFRSLERPDRAALDPSSAVHDRLDGDAERSTPDDDVLLDYLRLETGLVHGSIMPEWRVQGFASAGCGIAVAGAVVVVPVVPVAVAGGRPTCQCP